MGAEVGIATDILNLRSSEFSSVTTLMAAIERFLEAPEGKGHARLFQMEEAADIALTNIAAHAAEAMTALQPNTGGWRTRTQLIVAVREAFAFGV